MVRLLDREVNSVQPCGVPAQPRKPKEPRPQPADATTSAASFEPPDPAAAALEVTHEAPAAKNAAAVALGRLGGLKGGKARAASLSPEERTEIARRAASARWANRDHQG